MALDVPPAYRERGNIALGASLQLRTGKADSRTWALDARGNPVSAPHQSIQPGDKGTAVSIDLRAYKPIAFAYLYGDIDGLPVTLLIDREQRVAAIHAGLAKRKELDEQILKLLAE